MKHGYGKRKNRHPLYWVWAYMKTRCYNAKYEGYHNYGARGIRVCAQWLDRPKDFIEWGLANGWEPGLEIDRIDNDGDYTPNNCRFVTHKENSRNTRRSKWWHIDGVRYDSQYHAADELGVSYATIRNWCLGQTKRGKYYPPKEGCFCTLRE